MLVSSWLRSTIVVGILLLFFHKTLSKESIFFLLAHNILETLADVESLVLLVTSFVRSKDWEIVVGLVEILLLVQNHCVVLRRLGLHLLRLILLVDLIIVV